MPRRRRYESSNAWVWICRAVMYPLTRVLGRRKFRGLEKLNRPGPMIVVANHISHLDPIYDAVLIDKAGRMPRIMAKASLWKLPVVGSALRGTRQVPVYRAGEDGPSAVDAARAVLAEGGVVLIYPEGTVTREPDFWPMRPRPGVAALALSGDYPVVPVVHWGTQQVYNSYRTAGGRKLRLWPRQDVVVAVGDDIDLSEYRPQPASSPSATASASAAATGTGAATDAAAGDTGGLALDAKAVLGASLQIMNTIKDQLGQLRGEEPPTALFKPPKANGKEPKATGKAPKATGNAPKATGQAPKPDGGPAAAGADTAGG